MSNVPKYYPNVQKVSLRNVTFLGINIFVKLEKILHKECQVSA